MPSRPPYRQFVWMVGDSSIVALLEHSTATAALHRHQRKCGVYGEGTVVGLDSVFFFFVFLFIFIFVVCLFSGMNEYVFIAGSNRYKARLK